LDVGPAAHGCSGQPVVAYLSHLARLSFLQDHVSLAGHQSIESIESIFIIKQLLLHSRIRGTVRLLSVDMDAMRQSCRPKHQVLILKCYPKLQKDVVAVKANASELSYLLYYASTRRSKLQKVGAFLEKRTIVDVSKARTGYDDTSDNHK
jgi:hypothetical protein